MDYGYTLIGFNTYGPIFLQNHTITAISHPNYFQPNLLEPITHFFKLITNASAGGEIKINLPLLYKVKWIHGKIDLYDIYNVGHFKLLDEKYEDSLNLPPWAGIPGSLSMENYTKWLNGTTVLGRSRKDIIIEMEQKYPGLFKPIFINPSVPKPLSPKTPINSPPQIVVSNKSKKKQSKPPRDVALTKKYRNQRSKQTFPDWWEVKSE